MIHKFRSKNNPNLAIEIGEYDNGLYYIPEAVGTISPEGNTFTSISEIEIILGDELEMIITTQ